MVTGRKVNIITNWGHRCYWILHKGIEKERQT